MTKTPIKPAEQVLQDLITDTSMTPEARLQLAMALKDLALNKRQNSHEFRLERDKAKNSVLKPVRGRSLHSTPATLEPRLPIGDLVNEFLNQKEAAEEGQPSDEPQEA